MRNIDLWTGRIAGGLPCAGWQRLLEEHGFVDVVIGPPIGTFGGAGGGAKAPRFAVVGHVFLARKPA